MNKKLLSNLLLLLFTFNVSTYCSQQLSPTRSSSKTLSAKSSTSSNSSGTFKAFSEQNFSEEDPFETATVNLFMHRTFPPKIDYDEIYDQTSNVYALPYLRLSVEYARNLSSFLYKLRLHKLAETSNVIELIHDHKDKDVFEYSKRCTKCQSEKVSLPVYAEYLSTIDLQNYANEFQLYDHDRLTPKQKKRILQNVIIYAQSILYIQKILEVQNVPILERLVNFVFQKDPDISFGIIVEPTFEKSRTMIFDYLQDILTTTQKESNDQKKINDLKSLDFNFLEKLAKEDDAPEDKTQKQQKERFQQLITCAKVLLSKEFQDFNTHNTWL